MSASGVRMLARMAPGLNSDTPVSWFSISWHPSDMPATTERLKSSVRSLIMSRCRFSSSPNPSNGVASIWIGSSISACTPSIALSISLCRLSVSSSVSASAMASEILFRYASPMADSSSPSAPSRALSLNISAINPLMPSPPMSIFSTDDAMLLTYSSQSAVVSRWYFSSRAFSCMYFSVRISTSPFAASCARCRMLAARPWSGSVDEPFGVFFS